MRYQLVPGANVSFLCARNSSTSSGLLDAFLGVLPVLDVDYVNVLMVSSCRATGIFRVRRDLGHGVLDIVYFLVRPEDEV